MKKKVTIFWFRRDLRLEDNVGLFHSLQCDFPVLPIFIFDTNILKQLNTKKDRRVHYIHQALTKINKKLQKNGASLNTFFGNPDEIFKNLYNKFDIQAIYCNHDYEPESIKRDNDINNFFKSKKIPFKTFKDQVIFEKNEVVKNDGNHYTIYTSYKKKWLEKLTHIDYQIFKYKLTNFVKQKPVNIHTLNEIGFENTDMKYKNHKLDAKIIDNYEKYRDYPAKQITSNLGIALRFGTISIRHCVAFALQHSLCWLSELIWREFFMQILYHYPYVINQAFKSKYDFIEWRNNEIEFELWCNGKTGFPLVDAGMRHLNETGFMHNRVRMVAASFLCKELLIDWKWGEAYFAQKLNDFELSSNNGNWQWVAGTGCDSVPYFRIFNPSIQIDRFDKDLEYIRKWLPEFETEKYIKPIVNHNEARERALKVYNKIAKGK